MSLCIHAQRHAIHSPKPADAYGVYADISPVLRTYTRAPLSTREAEKIAKKQLGTRIFSAFSPSRYVL